MKILIKIKYGDFFHFLGRSKTEVPKNTFISLAPYSKTRKDAEGFLKYSLFLEYEKSLSEILDSKIQNNIDRISLIMEKTHECCYAIFSSSPYEIKYNFFGHMIEELTPNKESNKKLRHNDLTFLSAYNFRNNKGDNLTAPSIHQLILQEAVMCSYHAILTELLGNKTIESAKLKNIFWEKGPYELIQENDIDLKKDTIHFSKKSKSSKQISLSRKWKDLYLSNPLGSPNKFFDFLFSENIKLYPQFLSLYPALYRTKINAVFFNKETFKDELENKPYRTCINYIKNLINGLTPSVEITKEYRGNKVDLVYKYYIAEKAFNMNLMYSLLSNIAYTRETNEIVLYGKIMDSLEKCFCLPNALSRTYFVRFAMDHISPKCFSFMDYWFYNDFNRWNFTFQPDEESIFSAKYTANMPQNFQFGLWINQYKLFIDLMTKYAIPIYDWCFLTLLLNYIEETDTSKSKLDENLHRNHLITALHMLAAYINEHWATFFDPFSGSLSYEVDKGALCIVQDKNWDVFEEFFFKSKNYYGNDLLGALKHILEYQSDMELNLPLLDKTIIPGMFLGHNIHKFYETLIFNPSANK